MTPPPHYSASLLPSYATRPLRSPHESTLAEALRAILTWVGIVRPPLPTLRQLNSEARIIDALAAELAEQTDAPDAETPTRPVTKRSKRKPRA
jgi:hypothetical protein